MLEKQELNLTPQEIAEIEKSALQNYINWFWEKTHSGGPVPQITPAEENSQNFHLDFTARAPAAISPELEEINRKILKAHTTHCTKITVLEFHKMKSSDFYQAYGAGYTYMLVSSWKVRTKSGNPTYSIRRYPGKAGENYHQVEHPGYSLEPLSLEEAKAIAQKDYGKILQQRGREEPRSR